MDEIFEKQQQKCNMYIVFRWLYATPIYKCFFYHWNSM